MAQSAITSSLPAIPMQPTTASQSGVKPGHRLVPALIGKESHPQTVWVECPDWCIIDHQADRCTFLEDLNHESERRGMAFAPHTPGRAPRSVPVEVYVSHWPGSDQQPPTLAVDLDWEVENYDRTAALALADQLVAFAADVRRMAQTLPDNSPRNQADEALRRVRKERAA